ncbi:neutral amino acid transporter, partial [Clydaea vesicula]
MNNQNDKTTVNTKNIPTRTIGATKTKNKSTEDFANNRNNSNNGISMKRGVSTPIQNSNSSSLSRSIPRNDLMPSSLARSIPRSIPVRMATPTSFKSSNAVSFSTPNSSFQSNKSSFINRYGSMSQSSQQQQDEAQAQENAEFLNLIKEHLVTENSDGDPVFGSVSHSLLGGAITRDIYLYSEKRSQPSIGGKRRNSAPDISAPISVENASNETEDVITASTLRQPGGFRRHFIQNRAQREGQKPPNFLSANFIDFLVLYGFYGGDIEPEYSDESEDEVFLDRENQPLISSTRRSSVEIKGTSPGKAFFMVIKAFIGTGVLFLPRAFLNGGLIFSIVTLVILAWLTLHCMLLLVEVSKKQNGLSMGELAGVLYGSNMRQLVLWSIAISQMGFSSVYYIFIGKNLKDLLTVMSNCRLILPDWVFVLLQVSLYIPLSWVRNIKHFSITSLIGDVFILMGLAYILYYDIFTLVKQGGAAKNLVYFNQESFPLFIGSAMFAFEGICLMLPIGDSMKEPEKFPKVLSSSMLSVSVTFILVGSLGYITFGSNTDTIVFLNVESSQLLTSLELLYVAAIMLTFPLCVYPAVRITENFFFGTHLHRTNTLAWSKNLYRAGLVSLLGFISWVASDKL